MSKHEGLHVGAVQLDRMRDGILPELLAVFQNDMRRSATVSTVDYLGEEAGPDDDGTVEVSELAAPGKVIADRLDALGFTPATALSLLGIEILESREMMSGTFERILPGQTPDPDILAEHEAEMTALALTAEQWVQALRDAADSGDHGETRHVSGVRWLVENAGPDPRVVLRAALLAWPDAEVRLDVTEAEDFVPVDCYEALETLRKTGAEHAPMVVLTEGKTDVRVLETALKLLYPHLTDLVRFMDFDQRPMGSAGALVNTIRGFAAAGIANRVIALFDNDTAASDALRALKSAVLPSNIRVRQYPHLPLAEQYPTLGPPTADFPNGRTDIADVNGLACSIELYLGRDVLTLPDGRLSPVQWSSYVQGMRQYQGEVIGKAALHDAYEAKVRAASVDHSLIESQDWSGIRAIIEMILDMSGEATAP